MKPTYRLVQPPTPADVTAIVRLHDAAEAAYGHPSLNDAVWRDLDSGGRRGSAAVLAEADGRAIGCAHVTRADSLSLPHWETGVVLHPDHRDVEVEAELLDRVVAHVARQDDDSPIVLWVLDATRLDDQAAERAGFAPQRDLLQQRVALPLDEEPAWPDGTAVRAFVPGRDEESWLAVNNRAFANHPEQGGWIETTLRGRMTEPWFDPAGFLLAEDARGLSGFCWTKVHAAAPPGEPEALGEIFVIGVDPSRQGRGLGRALTLRGLAWLAGRGLRVGMLYVEGANAPALALYRSLGFTTHRRDRAFRHEAS